MPLNMLNSNDDEKAIKDIINKNIASSMRTQRPFAQLLQLNGCPTVKLGYVGSKIRKQLLKEAKNGDLTADSVMPRAYELMGEYLGISEVRTFDDMSFQNSSQQMNFQKSDSKKLNKQTELHLNKTHAHQLTSPQQNMSAASPADELLKYAELYEKGLLTKEEFEMKKSELLGFNAVEVKPDNIGENNPLEQHSIEDNDADQNGLQPKFCGKCGASIDYNRNFCPNCGAKLIKF